MLPGPDRQPNAVTFVGHACVLIEIDSVRVLSDPLLRGRVLFLGRRVPLPTPASVSEIDLVLISHLHRDHFDPASLRHLRRSTPFIVPRGGGPTVRSAGFTEVQELALGESAAAGTLRIEAVSAEHSGYRPPFGPHAEAVGYLVQGTSSVYFAGDTSAHPAMAALSGRVDLALLPVWGWGPNLRGGHMDPRAAARSLRLIAPRAAVPIHWGTYYPLGLGRFKRQLLHQPPRDFAEYSRLYAPEVTVHLLEPGQTIAMADL